MDNNWTMLLKTLFDYAWPIIEIFVLAVVVYYCLRYIRGTRGIHVLSGMAILLASLYLFTALINFEVINFMLSRVWTIIPFAVVVIFQPEFRRAFAQLGTAPFSSHRQKKEEALSEVVQAVTSMAKQKIGALVIFEREIGMRAIINSGVIINGALTHNLLESIFYPNSPLHDGAVFVKDDRIVAAHTILPLSQDDSLVRTLGTRHRAAIGVTEETDAVAVVVSEETGTISIAFKGHIRRDVKSDKLLRYLEALLLSDKKGVGETLNELLSEMRSEDEKPNVFSDQEAKNA